MSNIRYAFFLFVLDDFLTSMKRNSCIMRSTMRKLNPVHKEIQPAGQSGIRVVCECRATRSLGTSHTAPLPMWLPTSLLIAVEPATSTPVERKYDLLPAPLVTAESTEFTGAADEFS